MCIRDRLCRAREAIVARRATPLSVAISFLHREYEPHMWWWELVEMLRRLLLVGLMQIVVASGSALQIILGTVFSVVFLLFQVQSNPYVSLHDDHLSTACSFALTSIFICSIAFKYSSMTDLHDIQQKMSEEQRQIYVMDTSFLVMLLFVSICLLYTSPSPRDRG